MSKPDQAIKISVVISKKTTGLPDVKPDRSLSQRLLQVLTGIKIIERELRRK